VHAPPVVGEHVEDAEHKDEERGRPLGFEADGNHDACGEADDGDEDAAQVPFTLDDETQEKEDEENTAGKKETV
jgi:hypothetical protein